MGRTPKSNGFWRRGIPTLLKSRRERAANVRMNETEVPSAAAQAGGESRRRTAGGGNGPGKQRDRMALVEDGSGTRLG